MEMLICLVVAIVDGDTLKARCPDLPQQTIRIAQIDAPEKRQPWGEKSRQALATLCFQVEARIQPTAKDRYGRTVATVRCNGQDVGEALVGAGLAWAYTRYRPSAELVRLQERAQAARVGLWADAAPVPPWEWRRPTIAR